MRILKDIHKEFSLLRFSQIANKILILRDTGGAGDILMHRMLFEDFKLQMPQCHLTFACPAAYHDLIKDHPFLDDVVDSGMVNENNYATVYNTTNICHKYEMTIAPNCTDHRSDIWANCCGITLQNHNMHFMLTEAEKDYGYKALAALGDKKKVLISPKSAMVSKDLEKDQVRIITEYLSNKGYVPYLLHTHRLNFNLCTELSAPDMRKWLSLVYNSDYVISIDTATFHAAGGMQKPLMGIFTWSDGMVYGKYFNFSLVQKHRKLDPTWTCGPCYKWFECPKCPQSKSMRKPCADEIDKTMLESGLEKLFQN